MNPAPILVPCVSAACSEQADNLMPCASACNVARLLQSQFGRRTRMDAVTRLARAVIRTALADLTGPNRLLARYAYTWLSTDSPDLGWWLHLAGLRMNAAMFRGRPLESFHGITVADLEAVSADPADDAPSNKATGHVQRPETLDACRVLGALSE